MSDQQAIGVAFFVLLALATGVVAFIEWQLKRRRRNRYTSALTRPSPLCDRFGDWRAHTQDGRYVK